MRQKQQFQMSLSEPWLLHEAARELQIMSDLLDAHPKALDLVLQDLHSASCALDAEGAHGLSAEQVLRALILKQMNGFSYRALSFHLADSMTYRQFCRLGWCDESPSKSTLQRVFKQIRAETLEEINKELVRAAQKCGVENGRTIRSDATNVESNILEPQDSGLLWDCVRVLTRLMKKGQRLCANSSFVFSDRTKRAKRRSLEASKTGSRKKRDKAYRDLMRVTREVVEMAELALAELEKSKCEKVTKLRYEMIPFLNLTHQVLDQTHRRVINGESVPACEKVVSIFEEHTDILKKERRETEFGHKIFLTSGKSSIILDCLIVDGNPNDSTLAEKMIHRHIETYGKAPRQAAFDGGFASKENVTQIKKLGVKDVAFSKRRGIAVLDMVKSSWVYKKLRNFRAGIEGNISFLKRSFGLVRCTWRSKRSFHSYVWSSILAFNLLVFARHLMT